MKSTAVLPAPWPCKTPSTTVAQVQKQGAASPQQAGFLLARSTWALVAFWGDVCLCNQSAAKPKSALEREEAPPDDVHQRKWPALLPRGAGPRERAGSRVVTVG